MRGMGPPKGGEGGRGGRGGVGGKVSPQDRGARGVVPPDHTVIILTGRGLRGPSWISGRAHQGGSRSGRPCCIFHRQYLRVCCRERGSCAIQGRTTVRQPGAGSWITRSRHRARDVAPRLTWL